LYPKNSDFSGNCKASNQGIVRGTSRDAVDPPQSSTENADFQTHNFQITGASSRKRASDGALQRLFGDLGWPPADAAPMSSGNWTEIILVQHLSPLAS
jgi:hypothetical protein